MGWTWFALAVAFVSAAVAVAAGVFAYIGRPLQDDPERGPGFFTTGEWGRTTLVLTLLSPFLAAVSAGLSAVAILASP